MTKWEYTVAFVGIDSAEDMDRVKELGNEGWELVSVLYYRIDPEGTEWYFKRPLPPEPITLVHAVSCSTSYAPDIGISIPKETNEG